MLKFDSNDFRDTDGYIFSVDELISCANLVFDNIKTKKTNTDEEFEIEKEL